MFRYRCRWGRVSGPGRPMKPRLIGMKPAVRAFIPTVETEPSIMRSPIVLDVDEFEAVRLIDYEGLTQEEAARRMEVSRGTVWRCIDSARKKIASMLVEGRELLIEI
ncbi:MAG: DUF134 domain-containing protein [Candidatus Bathyarchaeia archaeon]